MISNYFELKPTATSEYFSALKELPRFVVRLGRTSRALSAAQNWCAVCSISDSLAIKSHWLSTLSFSIMYLTNDVSDFPHFHFSKVFTLFVMFFCVWNGSVLVIYKRWKWQPQLWSTLLDYMSISKSNSAVKGRVFG